MDSLPLCPNLDCVTRSNVTKLGHSHTADYVFGCIVSLLIPFIVTGNFLVLITLFRFPRFRNATNYLIGSLAFADLLLGLVTLPLYVTFYFNCQALSKIKYLCLIKYGFALGTLSASLFNLVAIAYDRFVAITRPLIYRVTMMKRKASFIILGIWCYHGCIILLPLLGWNNYNDLNQNGTVVCNYFTVLPRPYTIITTPVVIVIAIFIATFFYVRIYKETHQHNKRQFNRRSITSDTKNSLRQFKKDTKSAKMMALVSVLFFAFWLPFMIGCILKYTGGKSETFELIKNVFLVFAMSNSAVNPIIYCLLRRDFRTAFLMTICCKPGSKLRNYNSVASNIQKSKSSLFLVEKHRNKSDLSDSASSSFASTPRSNFSGEEVFNYGGSTGTSGESSVVAATKL